MITILADIHNLMHVGGNAPSPECKRLKAQPDHMAKEMLNGVLTTLFSLTQKKRLGKYGKCRIIGAIDSPGNWKQGLYPDYKLGRKHDPLTKSRRTLQFEAIIDQLRDFGIPCFQFPNLEADDVIGILARHPAIKGQKFVISGDKDLIAYVDSTTTYYNPRQSQMISKDMVKIHINGLPHINYYTLYRALSGDKSDSLSGVAGIGIKRAIDIVTKLHQADIKVENETPVNDIIWILKKFVVDYPDYGGLLTEAALTQIAQQYTILHAMSAPEALRQPVMALTEAELYPPQISFHEIMNKLEQYGLNDLYSKAKQYSFGSGISLNVV